MRERERESEGKVIHINRDWSGGVGGDVALDNARFHVIQKS